MSIPVGRLLARVPGIGWVIFFLVVTIIGGVWGVYASGKRAGTREVKRAAVRDSVAHQTTVVTRDSAKTDTAMTRAREESRRSAEAGRIRQVARSQLELVDSATVRVAGKLATVPPAVVTTLRADDAKIQQDSITMASKDSALAAQAAELRDRVSKEELQQHQVALEANGAGDGISLADVGIGAAILAATLELLRLFFHH